MGLVGALLDRAAQALPAAAEDRSSGWLLRRTDTVTWWSGAVVAHGPADALVRRVEAAEEFCAASRRPALLQVCPDCPSGLDDLLAARGYRRHAPIALLTCEDVVSPVAVASDLSVRVDDARSAEWLAVYATTLPAGADAVHETRLYDAVDRPQAFVTAFASALPVGNGGSVGNGGAVASGPAVAIGRAVADEGCTGIFSMVTVPEARRRGTGRLVLAALSSWAASCDAGRLYLQVEEDNAAALALYRSTGFRELARYHYRSQT